MRHRETKKLFYDEYPYKLSLRNSLGDIFRGKNFKHARDELDQLQSMYERNVPLERGIYRKRYYDIETFKEAKLLFQELTIKDAYMIRIENPILQLYSHDKDWLLKLSDLVKNPIDFYEPETVLFKNEILVDTPTEYKYRITLPAKVDSSLGKWIKNNPKFAKAGPVCLEEMHNNGYVKGLYFYVRDEKILNLVSLMLGKTCRIDKIICK